MLRTWIGQRGWRSRCAYAMLDKPDPLAAAAPIVEGYHAAQPLGRRRDRGAVPARLQPPGGERGQLGVPAPRRARERVPHDQRAAGLGTARAARRRASQVRALHVPRRVRPRTVPGRARRRRRGCATHARRHRPAARPRPADGAARRVRPGGRAASTRARRRSGPTAGARRAAHRAADARTRAPRSASAATTRSAASTPATSFVEAGQRRPGVAHRAPRPRPVRRRPARRCSRRSTAWCTASPTTTRRSTTARRSSSSTTPGRPGRASTRSTAISRTRVARRARARAARSRTATRHRARRRRPPRTAAGRRTCTSRSSPTCSTGAATSRAWRGPAERRVWLSLVARSRTSSPGFPDGVTAPRRPSARRPARRRAATRSGRRSASPTAGRSPSCAAGCSTSTTRTAARISTRSTTCRTSATATRASSRPAGGRWRCSTPTRATCTSGSCAYAERLCGDAARAAARLLLRQLRQRGQRARAAPGARRHRQPRDASCVDVGYHGNTNALVEISPYKFDGPGGARRAAARARGARCPTSIAGVYRGAGSRRRRARTPRTSPRPSAHRPTPAARVGAFIAESILSCGGQIVLPPGYLARRLRRRARGRRRVHRRRGAGRLRPRRHALLGLRDAGRRARHRDDGQAHRQRPPAGRGGHDAGDRRARSPTAWSTSTPSAAIPCRARSAWPCST